MKEKTTNDDATPSPWLFAALAFLSISLIAGCWDAGFTGRDDDRYVVRHPIVNGLKPLTSVFTDNSLELYIPVVVLSHRLDYVLFHGLKATGLGTWAPGVRAMSLLYHVLAGFILWRWVLPRLGVKGLAALFVTGVFLIHPAQCEAVCWIAERKTVLGGVFSALVMALYLRLPERSGGRMFALLAGILALLVLALMSKITALGVLPVLACWELLLWPDAWRNSETGRAYLPKLGRITLRLGALTLVSLPLLYINWEAAKSQLGIRMGENFFQTLLTDVEILARYLAILVWPPLSSPYYEVTPVASVFSARFAVALAGLAAPVALTLWLPVRADERRRVLFGWLWFVGAMSLALNLARQPEYMHDRYIYFSLPGVALAVALAAQGFAERVRLRLSPQMNLVPCASVCVMLALSALVAGSDWSSEIKTFERAVRVQPGSSFSHGYLGLALGVAAAVTEDRNKDVKQAREWRESAVAHLSAACGAADANYNLRRAQLWLAQGVLLQSLGRDAQAREVLQGLLKHAAEQKWSTHHDLNYLQKAEKALRALESKQ